MKYATFDFETNVTALAAAHTYLPALDLSLFDGTTQGAGHALLSPGKRTAFFMNAHCCNVMHRDRAYMTAVRPSRYMTSVSRRRSWSSAINTLMTQSS